VENHRLIKKVLTAIILSGLISCSDELDLSGILISRDQVNERFMQSMEWNNMHSVRQIHTDASSYSFLGAGDCHVGGTSNMDRFSKEASHADISFFLLAGDLTTGHKEDYDALRDHLNHYYTIPYFLIAGNHDLYFNGWDTFYSYFGSSTYTFSVETPDARDLFICLDTGSGTLGNRQLDWLENILENERRHFRNCIIISHSNFFRSRRTLSTTPLVEEIYFLLDLFSDNNVDMVIMGHDHERSVELFGNTVYLTLDAIEDGHADASFVRIENRNGMLEYAFSRITDLD
jgi:predicted phosphodiesterase